MGNIRAVFIDMDNTLYSHRTGMIPLSAFKAVRMMREKGIRVFCATGRHVRELEGMGIDIKLDGWITVNGAYCFTEQGPYYREPLLREDLMILQDELQKDPFPVIFLGENEMYMNMYDERVAKELGSIHTAMPGILAEDQLFLQDIYQFIPYAPQSRFDAVQKRFDCVRCMRWTDLAVDCINAKAGKDRGLRETCRMLGIDPEQACAFGDGPNDLDLFAAAGFSVAMGNASYIIKEMADLVTADIDEDGLYLACVRMGLIGEGSL